MPFKAELRLDSKLFDPDARKSAFRGVVRRSAKRFRRSLQEKMENSPHTGRIYTRGRGDGFEHSHRASRIGERPAPDTDNLVDSIIDTRTGDLTATVEIAAEYGVRLQKNAGRLLMTAEDLAEAQDDLDSASERALSSLL